MKKGIRKERESRKSKSIIKIEINKQHKEKINIEREGYKTYFEVIDSTGILHTYDVGEGVAAMMMCEYNINDNIWNTKLTEKDKKEVSAAKALYWLTGGNNEWIETSNYKVDWHEASIIFKKKFGGKITRIIRKADTLEDIRIKFKQNFNLSLIYEFALDNNII